MSKTIRDMFVSLIVSMIIIAGAVGLATVAFEVFRK